MLLEHTEPPSAVRQCKTPVQLPSLASGLHKQSGFWGGAGEAADETDCSSVRALVLWCINRTFDKLSA